MKEMYNKIEECAKYFKENKGFNRLFLGFKKKIQSLGAIGGKVIIKDITIIEKEALSGVLRKDFSHIKDAEISLIKFEKSLKNTVFEGVLLKPLVEEYFGENIISNKDKRQDAIQKREEFFSEMLNGLNELQLIEWLDCQIANDTNAYKWLVKKYNQDSEKLRNLLFQLNILVKNLPIKYNELEHTAVFAAKYLKNPHGLDERQEIVLLLYYYLSYMTVKSYPKNNEEKNELLMFGGLLRDPLSNSTLCKGLMIYKNGKIHKGWQEFYELNEPINITMLHLKEVNKIITTNSCVYIVENPAVMSELIQKSKKEIAIICSSGQINFSTYYILDKLAKEKTKMFYGGDFDPEGLLIADKLKSRYGSLLSFWCYSKENYKKALSNEIISEKRLNQLNNLKSEELKEIAEEIKKRKKAAYQETIIEDYKFVTTIKGYV